MPIPASSVLWAVDFLPVTAAHPRSNLFFCGVFLRYRYGSTIEYSRWFTKVRAWRSRSDSKWSTMSKISSVGKVAIMVSVRTKAVGGSEMQELICAQDKGAEKEQLRAME